ncbi:MAG: OmpA family protein [Muribaculaceae bacterium]
MKHNTFFAIIVAAFSAFSAIANESSAEEVPAARLNFGANLGLRANFMRFSDLDKKTYPDRNASLGSVLGIFGEYEFGKDLRYAIRPELDFTRRGGKICNIKADLLNKGLNNYTYSAGITYFDFRVPVIYQFLSPTSRIRPYAFAAPYLGFASAGRFKVSGNDTNGTEASYKVNAAGDNVARAHLALALGAGVKYYFPFLNYAKAYVGFEMSYDFGLTDTYSGAEKHGTAAINNSIFGKYIINGSRKFSGLELRFTFGVPIKTWGKQRRSPKPVLVEEEPPITTTNADERVTDAFAGTNCCSLDDIIDMMARGESVEGKTICAIDDINFDFNSSDIREDSFSYLDKLASTIIRMNAQVEVKGHTDSTGPDDVNMRISRQRAKAVMDYLITQGVNPNMISYSFYGATRPLVSNETIEGRRINRRVEVEILK